MRVLTERGQPGAAMIRTDATGKPTVIRRVPLLFGIAHAQPSLLLVLLSSKQLPSAWLLSAVSLPPEGSWEKGKLLHALCSSFNFKSMRFPYFSTHSTRTHRPICNSGRMRCHCFERQKSKSAPLSNATGLSLNLNN